MLAALARRADALAELASRLRCVPRILVARNRRLARPLSDDELRDLVQDVLAEIWRRLASFEGRSALETWVYGFCGRLLFRAQRQSVRRSATVAVEQAAVFAAEFASPTDDEELAALARGLGALETLDADIVRLKHFGELSFSDIAAVLDVPVGTTKSRYYRALGELRSAMRSSLVEESG